MENELQHPALRGFNPTWEGVKIVGGKMLKGAATGAAVIGTLLLGGGAIVTPIAAFLGEMFGSGGSKSALAAIEFGGSFSLPILATSAALGAGVKTLFSLPSISKEIEERKMDMIADYDQMMVARERHRMMNIARNQQAEYGQGVSAPTVGMGRNLAQNQGVMRG